MIVHSRTRYMACYLYTPKMEVVGKRVNMYQLLTLLTLIHKQQLQLKTTDNNTSNTCTGSLLQVRHYLIVLSLYYIG